MLEKPLSRVSRNTIIQLGVKNKYHRTIGPASCSIKGCPMMLASKIAKIRNLVFEIRFSIKTLLLINWNKPSAVKSVRTIYFEKKAISIDPVIKYNQAPISYKGEETLEDKYKFSPVFIRKSTLLVKVFIKPV
jgi:hypothetical protein